MSQAEIVNIVKSAVTDFSRNKVRTFLTSLGITIGVLSVLMLIALGIGLKNYIQQQFEGLGSNLIIILPGGGLSGEGGVSSFGTGFIGGAKFDERDYKNLQRIQEADYVVPSTINTTLAKANGNEELSNVQGVNEQAFELLNWKPIAGKVFNKSDVQRKAKVAFLGYTLAEKLFDDPKDAIGQTIRLENQRFKVIGVGEKKGDPDVDSGATMPYTTAFGAINTDKTFFTFYLGANSEKNIEVVKEKAKEILLDRYEEEDFSVAEQSEILDTVNSIFSIINGVLVAIGSISLIVGGIGIMNIMYATVTERIKEVGIRRAIGATEGDIMAQFLSEAILLSVFGGGVGLVLATVIVLLVQPFFPLGLNLFAVFITLAISSGIGIFFGVFPARSASKLPPIEAIRYE